MDVLRRALSNVKLKVEDFFKFCAFLRMSKLYLLLLSDSRNAFIVWLRFACISSNFWNESVQNTTILSYLVLTETQLINLKMHLLYHDTLQHASSPASCKTSFSFDFQPRVRFMSSSSSSCSSSFPFQSSEFGSSSISNRLAQVVWNDDWTRTIILE